MVSLHFIAYAINFFKHGLRIISSGNKSNKRNSRIAWCIIWFYRNYCIPRAYNRINIWWEYILKVKLKIYCMFLDGWIFDNDISLFIFKKLLYYFNFKSILWGFSSFFILIKVFIAVYIPVWIDLYGENRKT